MQYPTLPLTPTLKIAHARIKHGSQERIAISDDLTSDLVSQIQWLDAVEHPNLELLAIAEQDIEALVNTESGTKDQDRIEGRAACILYQAIEEAQIETQALDDPGFWRYVGLAYLWRFAVWREPKVLANEQSLENPSKIAPYVDGAKSPDCIPTRMYLRVKSLGGLGYKELAYAVSYGTDFWRSHILRVKIGEHPSLVRAMVQRQSDPVTRLKTQSIRVFAKELTRTLTNLVPSMLDDDDADVLVAELWNRQL